MIEELLLPNMRETAKEIQDENNVKGTFPMHPLPLSNANEEQPVSGKLRKLLESTNSSTLKKLEKHLLNKDEKLHELKQRCAHLLKVEKRCNDLHNELNLKKEHVEVLTKSQVCMQQQVNDSERKHTEDLTLLVSALEKSRVDLSEQQQLIEILAEDLQKMKSTLEYCKDELLRRDNKVRILEEDLKKANQLHSQSERAKVSKPPPKIHRDQFSRLSSSKSRNMRLPHWQPLSTVEGPGESPDGNSWQNDRAELQAKVAKLTREGELWKFEKTMLVSALHAAKKEFNHQHGKLNVLHEKLRRTKSSMKCTCETPHCHRVVEKHHHHCAVCRTKAERKVKEKDSNNDQSSNHIIMSLGEQLRTQMQTHQGLEEKLRSSKKQLSQSLKKLKTAEQDRAVIAEKLAQEQARTHMMKYDMEYQMSLLHDSLLESSARLEHVTSQLRESCHQKESVQKNLKYSLVQMQEASVDVVLENSAKALEFKSMKLLQRLMATRLRWGHTVAADCSLKTEHVWTSDQFNVPTPAINW